MKIECWFTGKTGESYLDTGIQVYLQRIQRYLPIRQLILPDVKTARSESPDLVSRKEAKIQIGQLQPRDYLVLLDEHGKDYRSVDFARWLEQKTVQVPGNLVFLIGGPYGFDEEVKALAKEKISLSSMTFSHQMVRLFLVEQLYRALAILHNEPYHHE